MPCRNYNIGLAVLAAGVWLGLGSPAVPAQPTRIPERVLRTLEAQQRNAPRQMKGHVAANIKDGMEMLPRPDGSSPEDVERAGAIAEAVVPRLEARRGQPMSAWQRKQVAAAALQCLESLEGPRKQFVDDLAGVTGLDPDEIDGLLPPVGPGARPVDKAMIARLESLMGRTLRGGELDALRTADDQNQAALKPIQGRFVRQLATLSGLSAEDAAKVFSESGR